MERTSSLIDINTFCPQVFFKGYLSYRPIINLDEITSSILSDNSYRLYTLYDETHDLKEYYFLTKIHNLSDEELKSLIPFCECPYHMLPKYLLCFRELIYCRCCYRCIESICPSEYYISKAIEKKNKIKSD